MLGLLLGCAEEDRRGGEGQCFHSAAADRVCVGGRWENGEIECGDGEKSCFFFVVGCRFCHHDAHEVPHDDADKLTRKSAEHGQQVEKVCDGSLLLDVVVVVVVVVKLC